MDYQVLPMGEVWSEGMFSVPSVITSKYIRLASAYQLKALLMVLSSGGTCSSSDISKAIGVPESEVCDLMSFWVEEGVLLENGTAAPVKAVSAPPEKAEEKSEPAPAPEKETRKVELMPVPSYTPAELTAVIRDNPELTSLVQTAQEVLGHTLSRAEEALIVNMNTYYGLPAEVVLTILQYYKTEKENGRALGTSYIAAMAKNWSEEGITTLDAADEKLSELEESDRLWDEVVDMSAMRFRKPTPKQREMVRLWYCDFNKEMISLACDTMRENAEKPTLKYVDSVLKNWKKKGIKTPEDVEKDNEKHAAKQSGKKNERPEIATTYDIDKIAKDALFNDDYDI